MHRPLLHALALSAALLLAAPSHALNGGSPTNAFGHLGTVGSSGLDGILIAHGFGIAVLAVDLT